MPSKSIVTGGALLVGIVVTACTQAPHPVQITALSTTDSMSADRAITLPDVVVTPQPYARGSSPRPSSENRIPVSHFRVWLGYDSQVALHPYTSGLGPCPEGGSGAGCEPWHGSLIKPSHYERPPFTN
jgi:hypothetical protein